MAKTKKIIPFNKRTVKVPDRSQAEIMKDRKEKRDTLLKRIKNREI